MFLRPLAKLGGNSRVSLGATQAKITKGRLTAIKQGGPGRRHSPKNMDRVSLTAKSFGHGLNQTVFAPDYQNRKVRQEFAELWAVAHPLSQNAEMAENSPSTP